MATWTGTLTEQKAKKKVTENAARPGKDRFKRFKIVPDSGEQFIGEVNINKDTLSTNTVSAITLTY